MEEKIIKPTVGRVVLFVPKDTKYEFGCAVIAGKPHAAMIAAVHGDRMVNLSVVDVNGKQFPRTSVRLRQPNDPVPTAEDYCEWMEYQIKKAAE